MDIKPFKAYRFNKEAVGNPGDCIAPPYDVIDSSMREELYNRSAYNIVRAINGKTGLDDTADDNVYIRANEYLEDAIENGVLTQEDKDAVYAYVQDFEIAGQAFQRSGIIAWVGVMLPLRELQSVQAQTRFSQVSLPLDDRGMTWSVVISAPRRPQY